MRGQLFVKLSRSVALERFDGSCQNQALTRGPHSATQLHSVAMKIGVAAVKKNLHFVKQYSVVIIAVNSMQHINEFMKVAVVFGADFPSQPAIKKKLALIQTLTLPGVPHT